MPAFDDETAQTTETTPRVADACDLMFEARSKLALVHSASEHFEGEDTLGLGVNGARVMMRDIANTLEAIQSTLDRLNRESHGSAAAPERLSDFAQQKADLDAAKRTVEAATTDDETDAAAATYRNRLGAFFAAPAGDADALAEKWRVIERELHDALFEGERAGTPELAWLAALKADCLRLASR